MKLAGENRNTGRKTCSCATLSNTNPTWTDPGSNPGLRGGRPATNRLSHGTVQLNDLVRDVGLPKDLAEILGSRLCEKKKHAQPRDFVLLVQTSRRGNYSLLF
jgi:hypothetical protein